MPRACSAFPPPFAADDEAPAKGAAVTVLKAAKSCFANIVEVSGTIIPREENQVRPERMGLKVAEVMVDAGDSVTAGQVLARLTLPEGGQISVQAPVGGVISASTASVGAMASGKGEALFSIIARGEFDLVGMVPTRDIAKLAGQPDRADQGDRRRRGRRQGAATVDHRRAEQPARRRCSSASPPTAACW